MSMFGRCDVEWTLLLFALLGWGGGVQGCTSNAGCPSTHYCTKSPLPGCVSAQFPGNCTAKMAGACGTTGPAACSCDGRTFVNTCSASSVGVQLSSLGACGTLAPTRVTPTTIPTPGPTDLPTAAPTGAPTPRPAAPTTTTMPTAAPVRTALMPDEPGSEDEQEDTELTIDSYIGIGVGGCCGLTLFCVLLGVCVTKVRRKRAGAKPDGRGRGSSRTSSRGRSRRRTRRGTMGPEGLNSNLRNSGRKSRDPESFLYGPVPPPAMRNAALTNSRESNAGSFYGRVSPGLGATDSGGTYGLAPSIPPSGIPRRESAADVTGSFYGRVEPRAEVASQQYKAGQAPEVGMTAMSPSFRVSAVSMVAPTPPVSYPAAGFVGYAGASYAGASYGGNGGMAGYNGGGWGVR